MPQCFWATVCKTVRPMLSDRCLAVLSCLYCLWLWCTVSKRLDGSRFHLACRPRPRPHCVRWEPSSPPRKGAQQNPPTFRLMSIVAKRSPISATANLLLVLTRNCIHALTPMWSKITITENNKKASIRWQDSARRQFQAGLRRDVGL